MILSNRSRGMDASAFDHLMETMSTPGLINFGGGNPDSALLPDKELSSLAERLLAENGKELLQYGPARGLPELLSRYRSYLSAYRSIEAAERECVIVNGGTQGIELICEALLDPGDVALVESPTFLLIFMILQRLGVRCAGVKTDADGIDPEDLEEKVKALRPKLLYLIPTFQNPAGTVLADERRRRVVALAEQYGFYVLEDDPYYDLRYAGEPLPSLKSLDEASRVIEVTSFSKIISPGLRVGGICAAEEIVSAAVSIKQSCDMHTPGLSQALCAGFIREGLLTPHIERVCRSNRAKLARMVRCINEYFPEETRFEIPQGGLFLWLRLPESVPAGRLVQQAVAEHKTAYLPGNIFFPDPESAPNCIRLNFANATGEQTEDGIRYLGGLFRTYC